MKDGRKGDLSRVGAANPSSLISRPSSFVLAAHEAIRVAAPDKPIERIAVDEKRFVRALRDPFSLFSTGQGLDRRKPDPHWQIIAISSDPNFQPRPAVVITKVPRGYARMRETRANGFRSTPICRHSRRVASGPCAPPLI